MRPVSCGKYAFTRFGSQSAVTSQSGFALLEVAVALVLLSLGAGMSMHLQGRSLHALQAVQWQLLAHRHAHSATALYEALRSSAESKWKDQVPLLLQPLQAEVARQLPQGLLSLESTTGSGLVVRVQWQSNRMEQATTVQWGLLP